MYKVGRDEGGSDEVDYGSVVDDGSMDSDYSEDSEHSEHNHFSQPSPFQQNFINQAQRYVQDINIIFIRSLLMLSQVSKEDHTDLKR